MIPHPRDWPRDFYSLTIADVVPEEEWKELMGQVRGPTTLDEFYTLFNSMPTRHLLLLYTGVSKEIILGREINHGVNLVAVAAMAEHVLAEQLNAIEREKDEAERKETKEDSRS